jgi:hypothetical protein
MRLSCASWLNLYALEIAHPNYSSSDKDQNQTIMMQNLLTRRVAVAALIAQ